jgi:hypothetical protein
VLMEVCPVKTLKELWAYVLGKPSKPNDECVRYLFWIERKRR